MRLFLYLLALLTGLSVAEAGQIARAAPVAMDRSSAVSLASHAAVGSEQRTACKRPLHLADPAFAAPIDPPVALAHQVPILTVVERCDRMRA